jgi:hypothetical protein
VAGKPRRRARRAAEEAERVQGLLEQISGGPANETAPEDMPWVSGIRPDPALDREYLERWWREHMAAMELATAARRELLGAVSEHPSAIFARQARVFGALGMPRDMAAVLLEISEAQFASCYGNEYAVGSAGVLQQVSANMLRIAMSTNDRVAVKAATEFLNRRGGEEWRPPAQKLEIDDSRKAKGKVIDSSQLTWEQRQMLRDIIVSATGRRIEGDVVATGVVPQIESEEAE